MSAYHACCRCSMSASLLCLSHSSTPLCLLPQLRPWWLHQATPQEGPRPHHQGLSQRHEHDGWGSNRKMKKKRSKQAAGAQHAEAMDGSRKDSLQAHVSTSHHASHLVTDRRSLLEALRDIHKPFTSRFWSASSECGQQHTSAMAAAGGVSAALLANLWSGWLATLHCGLEHTTLP